MIALSPEIATLKPKLSNTAPSAAVSLACWLQLFPERMNTYAEPELGPASSSPKAPTTAVSPETATLKPKKSPAAPSAARSFATSTGVTAQLGIAINSNAPARASE